MKKSTDLEAFLSKIVGQARELLNAQGASIFLMEGDELVLRATTGLQGNYRMEEVRYRVGDGLTGTVARDRKPIVLLASNQGSVQSKFREYDEVEQPKENVISFMAVPIISDEAVIGVIRCTNKTAPNKVKMPFDEQDIRLLEVFAKTAAAAIEAQKELYLATNAPYVFVLIPFSSSFHDVYELGIKNTVQSLGMRCAKVDEIEFNDSILAEIYKGIQSADIVVADMTGRNPNVFYEVGYAHALQKQVILLTQDATDIPFDLKIHNHIIYSGQITLLRERLARRLKVWLEAHDAE
jgi:putative methionine-R-sulfoxide reductase with GAF domain